MAEPAEVGLLSRLLRRRRLRRLVPRHPLERMAELTAVLVAILTVHTVAMMAIEGYSFGDALWLTLTSATTVGYGDLAADTLPGRLVTTVLIYIAGIALLAQVAGLWFEHRQDRRARMMGGHWSWLGMQNHIVFLNVPEEAGQRYFEAVVANIRESADGRSDAPVLLVDGKYAGGLPDPLVEAGVVHVSLPVSDPRVFAHASIAAADTVVVMAHDRHEPLSDGIAFSLVDRVRAEAPDAWLIAEVVEDHNRARIRRAGADSTLRPVRGYPEMMARAILSHRSEEVMETLFNASGEECMRFDLVHAGAWADLVRRFLEADAGLPVAYEGTDGRVVTNPRAGATVETVAVFALTHPSQVPHARALVT